MYIRLENLSLYSFSNVVEYVCLHPKVIQKPAILLAIRIWYNPTTDLLGKGMVICEPGGMFVTLEIQLVEN